MAPFDFIQVFMGSTQNSKGIDMPSSSSDILRKVIYGF